jgi:hypothetical protein
MAKIDLVGKKFVKTTPVEVIDATEHQVLLQDVNKENFVYVVSMQDFEKDYTLGKEILDSYAMTMTKADDGMAVPNNENNTKEVEETK